MSVRKQRVGEEIRKVISERLIRGLRTPLPGFVTVSGVEVTADLSVAKVYFSVYGSPAECVAAKAVLEAEKKALRQEVGAKVKLRQVPEIILIHDDTAAKAARINELLHDVSSKKD